MSLTDIDVVLQKISPLVDSIEATLTDDDSLLSQVIAGIKALQSAQGGDTTNEVAALNALLGKLQPAQDQINAQKTTLQATVASLSGTTRPAAAS